MKKLLALMTVAGVAASCLLTACRGVIFDTIRDEIALDDAQVTGDINSIVRFTVSADEGEREYLFVQNGTIWMKDVDDAAKGTPTTEEPATGYNGNWTRISQPAANIIKMAADSTYLYALSAPTKADNDDTGDNIETGRNVWYTATPDDADSWKMIDFGGDYGETIATDYGVHLFCTNTPQKAHRHAYVNINDEVIFELNGGTVTDLTDSTAYATVSTTTVNFTAAPSTSSKSATVLGSDVYFSTYYAMTSNETISDDATYIYYANGDDLYYYKAGDLAAELDSSDPGDVIYSISCTSDYLLLGTAEGLVYVTLSADEDDTDSTANVIPGSTASSLTNAGSTLSSYYEVWAVLTVDPAQTATGGDQYGATTFSGTSASFSNVCLWGYYPGRGKWNCE